MKNARTHTPTISLKKVEAQLKKVNKMIDDLAKYDVDYENFNQDELNTYDFIQSTLYDLKNAKHNLKQIKSYIS